MKNRSFVVLTAAVMTVTATASVQTLSAAADSIQFEAEQSAALNYVMSELGITDFDLFAASLSSDDVPDGAESLILMEIICAEHQIRQ